MVPEPKTATIHNVYNYLDEELVDEMSGVVLS